MFLRIRTEYTWKDLLVDEHTRDTEKGKFMVMTQLIEREDDGGRLLSDSVTNFSASEDEIDWGSLLSDGNDASIALPFGMCTTLSS